jgi:hypothetical protein
MKITPPLLIIASLALLSGCATNLPPHAFLPHSIDAVEKPLVANGLGEVKVTLAKSKVGEHLNAENFRIALIEVIKRSNIFGLDSAKPVIIEAQVYDASFPSAGFTMESRLGVHYKVIGTDGKLLFDKDIFYEGKATMGEEFFGSARALKAFQAANQGHFSLLIAALKEALQEPAK